MLKPFSLSWAFLFPLLFLAVFTLWSAEMDLAVSRWFYQEGHFSQSRFLNGVFHYGIFPAWIVVILAAAGWIASFFSAAFKSLRRPCLFLLLVLGIGSGLIVHALLKDHWGRPRPKQVIEFGGKQPFRPYYEPHFFNQVEPSKSFPCGHCSMGFYFFAFVLLGKHYRSRVLYYLGLALSIGLGGVLSLARLAQGGHFLSDVIVSGIIMWLTTCVLYNLILGQVHDSYRFSIRINGK